MRRVLIFLRALCSLLHLYSSGLKELRCGYAVNTNDGMTPAVWYGTCNKYQITHVVTCFFFSFFSFSFSLLFFFLNKWNVRDSGVKKDVFLSRYINICMHQDDQTESYVCIIMDPWYLSLFCKLFSFQSCCRDASFQFELVLLYTYPFLLRRARTHAVTWLNGR